MRDLTVRVSSNLVILESKERDCAFAEIRGTERERGRNRRTSLYDIPADFPKVLCSANTLCLWPVNRKRILEVNRAKSTDDTILGETFVPHEDRFRPG